MQILIEIQKTIDDSRVKNLINKNIIEILDIYYLELLDFSESELIRIANSLTNEISESWKLYFFLEGNIYFLKKDKQKKIISNSCFFNWNGNSNYCNCWIIEKSLLPGVTDNCSNIAFEIVKNITKFTCIIKFSRFFIGKGKIPDLNSFFDPLIEKISICNADEKRIIFTQEKNEEIAKKGSQKIEILSLTKEELLNISNKLCLNLNLAQIIAVQKYFKKQNRNPSDIELETIAQTWSEHCKHNIFSYPIDEIQDGIFKTYIKASTEKIIKENPDHICASVFSDNAGAIYFDENHLICVKVETHNSPCALEPVGGAMTGILGVNRDILGFGMGAKPIANYYAFCFDNEELEDQNLFRDKVKTLPKLQVKSIIKGVIKGLNIGGNCSGIPTVQGLARYSKAFAAKPLVFVGSVGIIPREVKNKQSHIKKVNAKDLIVIIGGRTGRDGVHGATFSSSAISEHNVKGTEVQIGNPFTQKKLSDALVKEIRDFGLYNSITDNGAGGFSSSVGEMGINGFSVKLENALLKYKNLNPWEIWISESQERMTLAVPKENLDKLTEILKKHDVEYCIIGEFNNSGSAVITYNNQEILNIDCNFLHEGNPKIHLETKKPDTNEKIEEKKHNSIQDVLDDKNIFGNEFIAKQYDHEVQGISVLKPLQGKNKVFADATVIKPVANSDKGLAQSMALAIITNDPYKQTAIAIEQAIRNIITVGANPKKIALLDNFCWSDSNNPERLWQLKNSAKACYDYSIAFKTPFISGKDSMFNDFKGYNNKGEEIHVRNYPTLLVTAIGIVDDIKDVVSLDAKFKNDLIYTIGKSAKSVNSDECSLLYKIYNKALKLGIISSAISVNYGGRIAAFTKKIKANGFNVDLSVTEEYLTDVNYHPEIMVSIDHQNKNIFEDHFKNIGFKTLGKIT